MHPYIWSGLAFLTGDSDGDAFEDGVEAERGYEQYAVAEGARVAYHGRDGVVRRRPVRLPRDPDLLR
jgi:hypothetical protein